MRGRDRWLALGLLLILFALLALGAREISITSDEPAHIAAGYSILARGEQAFWIFPPHGHPPLLNVMEASLFYLANPHIPLEELDGWPMWLTNYVRDFAPYLRPIEQVEVTARTPIILLTVFLGALIFRWGRDLWGPRAGILALIALVFDPTLLAHGQLATTDVGSLALGTAALYLCWRWMERPSWKLALGTGALLGLTMIAKSSGVLWTATAGLIVVGVIYIRRREGRSGLLLIQGVAIGALSLLLLWAAYGFTWGPVRDWPISLPAPAHWNGLISQAVSSEKRWVFALEERQHGHWWWYFPLAFVIKNPIPFLLGWGIGLTALLRRPLSWTRALALGLFPLVYTASSVSVGMNIGYRHMLPIHPFLYLMIGGGLSYWGWKRQKYHWRQVSLAALGVWYIATLMGIYPYEIAYFNELVGGPENGHHYLVDSNIDWGQGYKALREYLESHPGPVPKIAYHFTNTNPGDYGIVFEPLPPEVTAPPLPAQFHPPSGRYVISVTTLQRGWPEAPDMYAWFRQIEPTAELAHSFFLYDVESPPLAWFGQCVTPTMPLSEKLVTEGFGRADLRQTYFDCTNAWLYPDGGASPGAYGLHHALAPARAHALPSLLPSPPQPTDPFIARRLADMRLSFDMRRYTREFPAFVLYEQTDAPEPPTPLTFLTLPAAAFPSQTSPSQAAPIVLDGPLTFLGAAAYPYGEGLDVETWWRVTEESTSRPFSIMGHLLSAQGEALGIADGLGVSPLTLATEDVLVQRHRFAMPPGDVELWLRTGAYWLDTQERWKVSGDPDADAIFTRLEVQR